MVAINARDCNRYNEIENSKCKTVGTVVSSGNTIEYEYSVDGKDYLSKTSSKGIPSNIEINNYDRFWVNYDCEDPSSSIIDLNERYTDTISSADEPKEWVFQRLIL